MPIVVDIEKQEREPSHAAALASNAALVCVGGAAGGAQAVGHVGQPCGNPQGKSPGLFCPAHPDTPGLAAACIPNQAVAAGNLPCTGSQMGLAGVPSCCVLIITGYCDME